MAKRTLKYYEFDGEKIVFAKDMIIFLDDLLGDFETGTGQNKMLLALKGFFKRMTD